MAELPDELFIEILPWMPVNSLMRFRCLSKSICAVIDSPGFINSHLSKSSQNFNLRKLIFRDTSKKLFHVCDVNFDLEEEIIQIEKSVSSSWEQVNVCGYCNGLLLLYRGFAFTLWNPSIRQFRNIHFPLELEGIANIQSYSFIGWGLGYDDAVDDYKAFLMLHVQKTEPKYEVQFWIHGLKSNIWRRAENWDFENWDFTYLLSSTLSSLSVYFPGLGCFTADGSLHWLCSTSRFIPEIVSFDVSKETLSFMPKPISINLESLKIGSLKLQVLEGCLCISYLSSSVPLQADLYIRKKDGAGKYTWTSLFSVIEPLFLDKIWIQSVKVLGYSKRGDKILIDFNMGYMVSYNLKEKSFEKVETDKNPIWKGETPILCLESLVKVSGGAKSEI